MIFVTGGTGLIGSQLLYRLAKKGLKVKALKRTASDVNAVKQLFGYYEENTIADKLFSSIEWVEGDLLDCYFLSDTLRGCELVYHCAAFVSFEEKHADIIYKINVEGTANIANACLECNVKKLLFVSSIAALDNSVPGQDITEDHYWKSNKGKGPYAISKYISEQEVWRASEEGLNVLVVNPSLVIGPACRLSGTSALMAKAKNRIPFYTDGLNGYIDARDIAEILIRLAESDIVNTRYVLNSENLSYLNFITLLNQSFGHQPPFFRASPFMLRIASLFKSFLAKVLNTKNALTKYTVASLLKKTRYSNKKISELLNYKFIPVAEAVTHAADYHKRYNSKK